MNLTVPVDTIVEVKGDHVELSHWSKANTRTASLFFCRERFTECDELCPVFRATLDAMSTASSGVIRDLAGF